MTFFNHQKFCNIRSKYADDRLILLINILVAGVLNLALPSILILIVNITMLCFIKRIYSIQTYDKIKRRSDITNYRSTRSTLLVISMTYTLFYLPYIIFYFLMIILEDKDSTLYICSEITYILRHVSHSVNFYAYIFTNLHFRHEVFFLLRYLFRPCFNFKERQKDRQKRKSQFILLNKFHLSPPVYYSSTIGKFHHPTSIRLRNQIDFKQQEQNKLNRKTEVWM